MPLYLAAEKGHIDIVRALIEAGAEVNAKDEDGWTSLHMAAVGGHPEVVKRLIGAGAEVNAKAGSGVWEPLTPLDMARLKSPWTDPKKQAECAELLKKHGARTSEELDSPSSGRRRK